MSAERIDVRVRLIAARLRDEQSMNSRSKEVYADQLDSIAADVSDLIKKVEETSKFLTHEQWGSYRYMEGSDVYDDLRKHADMLSAALTRCGGAP